MRKVTVITAKAGPWDAAAFATLEQWDPTWSAAVDKMASNPRTDALDRKTVELVSVAINAACTSLNPDGTRRHIRGALDAGATRDELLMVLKMAPLLSIHACMRSDARCRTVERRITCMPRVCAVILCERHIKSDAQQLSNFRINDAAGIDASAASNECLGPRRVDLIEPVPFPESWNRASQYKSGTSRTHANASVPKPAPPTTQTSISRYQMAVNTVI